jgi:hypothetical protein
MTNPPRLIQRLRDQAALIRQWDQFKLGHIAPEPINYAALAELLEQAANRITQLEQQR